MDFVQNRSQTPSLLTLKFQNSEKAFFFLPDFEKTFFLQSFRISRYAQVHPIVCPTCHQESPGVGIIPTAYLLSGSLRQGGGLLEMINYKYIFNNCAQKLKTIVRL